MGYARANEQAAVAHMQARNAHRAAGNFDKADEHDRMAKGHEDKSDRAERMEKEDRTAKLPLHGNLDRPAVLNKPGYRGR